MRVWLSWAVFLGVMAIPARILLVVAWRSADATRVAASARELEERVTVSKNLTREVELAILREREGLTEIPVTATPTEIEAWLARIDDRFATPFIRHGTWGGRPSLVDQGLATKAELLGTFVVPRGPGVESSADTEVPETWWALMHEPIGYMVLAPPETPRSDVAANTQIARMHAAFVTLRYFDDLAAGWMMTKASVQRGARAFVPPHLDLVVREERATQGVTELKKTNDPRPNAIGVVMGNDDDKALLPAATTAEDAADFRVGPDLLFRVVPRDPAQGERLADAESRHTKEGALLGVLLMLGAASLVFLRAQRAQKLAELRTDFVAAVSHELRTPLASVRMFAELLEANAVPPDERAEVERTLAGETRRLHATLDRMLRFGALARGKLVVEKADANLAALAGEAVQRLRRQHRGAEVRIEIDPSLVASLDAGLVGLALDNLLANAAKYAPDGGPYVVRAAGAAKNVTIAVVDHGPGLNRSARARVFRPFDRADARLSKATQGTGVGLALVRGIAQAHGGDATVESAPGQGAIFTLRFPRS